MFAKPNRVVGVTPMEYAFEIESSAGCRVIVSLLVVTTRWFGLADDVWFGFYFGSGKANRHQFVN